MAGFEAYTLPEMIRSVKRGPTCQAPEPATNCNCLLRLPEVRLLQLAEAKDSSAFLREVQQPLQQQLEAEKHRAGCPDGSRYPVMVSENVPCKDGWEIEPLCRFTASGVVAVER